MALCLRYGYSLLMADSGDMDALAQRYIDMWQAQVAQISTDPKITDAWGSVLQNTAQKLGWSPDAIAAYTAVLKGAAAASGAAASQAGTETSAAASDDGGDDPAALLRRINALKRRLDALETD